MKAGSQSGTLVLLSMKSHSQRRMRSNRKGTHFLPATMPRWQQWAAHAGHAALYLLMLAIPLTGWLMSSAKGFQTVYFGVLPIPDLMSKDKELGDLLRKVHEALNWTLVVTVAGHVAAAVKHHVLDHDDVLVRMAPWLKEKS